MANAGNIGGNWIAVAKSNPGHFSKSRVWLFGSHGFDNGDDPSFKRIFPENSSIFYAVKISPESGGFDFFTFIFVAFPDQLIEGWHLYWELIFTNGDKTSDNNIFF